MKSCCRQTLGKRCAALLLLISFALGIGACSQQDEDKRGVVVIKNTSEPAGSFGNYHAIIIGINAYEHWPDLSYAEGDASDLYRILASDYGFDPGNTVALFGDDATRQRILSEIRLKLESLEENDNLFIFYAGHGQLDPLTESGFWIPVGGHLYDDSSWVRFSTVLDYLKADNIKAKSIVIVTDSCYGGAIARSGPTPGHKTPDQGADRYQNALRALAGARSRQVIASGGYEQVPDRSRFADLFKTALQSNTYELVDIEYLFFKYVHTQLSEYGEQRPAMARVAQSPDANGQFVLVRNRANTIADHAPPTEDTLPDAATPESVQEIVPALSTLTVRSNVSNDAVTVDGQHKGSTRLDMDILPGSHRISVSKPGYTSQSREVVLAPQQHLEIFFDLQPIEIPAPKILQFSAKPLSLRPTESTTLFWQTQNASSVRIRPATNDELALAGSYSVTPDTTTTYVLEAKNSEGVTTTQAVEINVSARIPRILSFDVTPERARYGERVTVSWRTEDASRASIKGLGDIGTSGQKTLTATTSRRFVLEAVSDDEEMARAGATLEVIGPPKVAAFTAKSATIRKGNSTSLSWSTQNAERAELIELGGKTSRKAVSTQGSQNVSPTVTTRYRLIAYGGSAQHETDLIVTVKPSTTAVNPATRITIKADDARTMALRHLSATKLSIAASGSLALKQTYTVDLDTGKIGGGTISDLWFQARTATQRYMTPRNGAAIALLTNKPGYAGCTAAKLSTASINISKVTAGTSLCVKTNRGRISEFKIQRAAGASPGTLRGTFTTWQ